MAASGFSVIQDPREQALQFYIGKGLTPQQAAGVVRRLNIESGGKPGAFDPAGGGQGALGIAQWRGPRQRALLASPDPHSLQGQLDFSWSELEGPERKALDAIRASKNEQDAYDAFTSLYERPGPTREAARELEGGGGTTTASGASPSPTPFLDGFLGMMAAKGGGAAQPAPSPLDELLGRVTAEAQSKPLAGPPKPTSAQASPLLDELLKRVTAPARAIGEVGGALLGTGKQLAEGVINTAKLPGDFLLGKIAPGTPEAESAARQFVSTFGLGAAPEGAVASGIGRGAGAESPPGSGGGGPRFGHDPDMIARQNKGVPLVPAVRVGGRLYQGATHGEAYDAALRDNHGVDPGSSASDRDLFIGPNGQILSHQEAVEYRKANPATGGGAGGEWQQPHGSSFESPPGTSSVGPFPAPQSGGGLPRDPRGPPAQPPPPPPPPPPIGHNLGPPMSEPEGGFPRSWTEEHLKPPSGKGGESQVMRQRRLGLMHETQDKLFKLWTSAESDKLRFIRTFRTRQRLTPEEKNQIIKYLEWQPGMPPVSAPTPRAMEMIENVIKPSREEAAKDFLWLKKQGALDPATEEMLEEATEGYLHRMRFPRAGEPHPFSPFGGVRGLRQKTTSMKPRGWWVAQTGDKRFLMQGPLKAPLGTKFRSGGVEYEARRATMDEIEEATDERFIRDPVFVTLHNQMQLRLARRTVETLKGEILPEMDAAGLTTTDAGAARRRGFIPSQVPVLQGHYFEPRLAKAFDDFYKSPTILSGEFADALEPIMAVNRWAIASMFLNPLSHMRNVASDFGLSRGALWASPPAYYRLAGHSRAALNDVWNKTPFYHEILKNGGALMGASTENRIAYNAWLVKMRNEMQRDPVIDRLAKLTGVYKDGKEWAEAIWNGSQRIMWGFHDLLMVTRVRELMGDGMPMPQAIKEAERFIANYRVPARIEGTGKVSLRPKLARGLSVLMQDRSATVFGRYHYNKLAAFANTIRDANAALTRAGIPASKRAGYLGRLGFMLFVSTIAQFGINYIAQQLTGNPNARASVPGTMGIPANAARVASDLYKANFGQARWDFVAGLLSIITPLPMLTEIGSQWMNRDVITDRPVSDKNLPVGQQAKQRASHFAGEMFSPGKEIAGTATLLGDLSHGKRPLTGGVPSLGISLPEPTAVMRSNLGKLSEALRDVDSRIYQARRNGDLSGLRDLLEEKRKLVIEHTKTRQGLRAIPQPQPVAR